MENDIAGGDESGDRIPELMDVLVAVGGDGTFHECVNGMMKRIQAGYDPPLLLRSWTLTQNCTSSENEQSLLP